MLISGLANKKLANAYLDGLVAAQKQFNAAMDKLDADGASTPGTTAIYSSFTSGMTTVVTIEADNVGTVGNALLTGDGVSDVDTLIADWNLANPSNTLTLTSGDGSQIPDLGATMQLVGGTDPSSGAIATDYSDLAIASVFDPEAKLSAQNKAAIRTSMRSAMMNKRVGDALCDALADVQVSINGMLAKLDDQAGTLTDTDFEAMLAVEAIDADSSLPGAQNKAPARRVMTVAIAHTKVASMVMDALVELANAMDAALAQIDTGTIAGQMAAFKVSEIDPDAEIATEGELNNA